MTITLAQEAVIFGEISSQGAYSYDLGDGRVLVSSIVLSTEGDTQFSVRDLDTGAELVAPTIVDADTVRPPASDFDTAFTGVFAAQGLPGGGLRIHYTQANAIINFGDAAVQYTRDFAADGTPLGAGQQVGDTGQFFLPRNTVHELLSNGDIVLAHDSGITVLAPDGSVRGGFEGGLGFSYASNGYSVTEVANGFLLVETKPGDFPGATAPIQGRFFDFNGSPRGEKFDIVADQVQAAVVNYTIGSSRLDVDTLANGDIVVVYADNFAEGGEGENKQGGLSGLILNPDGSIKVERFVANPSEVEGRQTYPVVDALEGGGFVVTYDDSSTVENRSVFSRVQRFDDDGVPVGEAAFNQQDFFVSKVVINPTQTVIGPDGSGLIIGEGGTALTIDIAAAPPPPPLDQRGDDGPNALTGDARGNRLEGLGGNDTLDGAGGDDVLLGGAGNDLMRGGDGADVLNGNAGADTLEGGAGSDVYFVDAGDTVIEASGAAGFDEMRVTVEATIAQGIEQLTALGGGNVQLNGSAGDEVLLGNTGANILVGFGGEDTMTGGTGADVFVLTDRAGSDPNATITDWATGDDRLAIDDQLLGIGANGIDVRDLTASVFRDLRDGGGVGYNGRTGELSLDIDGDGDRELVATLEGGAQLGLDDVLLF